MLNLDMIPERLAAPGFQPSVMHLWDRRSYRGPHPDFIAIGRGVVVIVDAEKGVPRTIDAWNIVSIDKGEPNR